MQDAHVQTRQGLTLSAYLCGFQMSEELALNAGVSVKQLIYTHIHFLFCKLINLAQLVHTHEAVVKCMCRM